MADDIRRWSDELARDPASLAFLPLGEALRRQGQVDMARRVALRGLERHPHQPDAHDLLARIHVDAGELQQAFDEWDMALRIAPDHTGSLKGMAFVCYQQGRFAESEEYLRRAALGETPDAGISAALDTVRRSSATLSAADVAAADAAIHDPHDPRLVFLAALEAPDRTALLLDASGLVLAGAYYTPDGQDIAPDVGAQLSGVSDEADRATRHLGIGEWRSIVFETEVAVVAMAPAAGDGLLVLAASRATPLGLLRRLLDRCAAAARTWLDRQGGGA
ncbi:MAG: tetratricopeptide repeat protein [Gemmatimonadota bacterium]|nr:tetratricopeptide repeat protein [Gemmatimonadota bacterium]MDE3173626.1 tetratricopeptide repeat protein [Gemmatimonadota bacterium]MDE3214915.1 tetratricopeptide repeat protein [Gemmatimonadota bacterium]